MRFFTCVQNDKYTMNPFNILKYQLYLLQLENYEIGRYWSLLLKKGYLKSKTPLRKTIVWTAKARLIFLLSFLLWAALSLLLLSLNVKIGVASIILGFFDFPFFYTFVLVILLPFDFVLKIDRINKAKSMIANAADLKIIGIAGSYGKTSMKAALKSVLSQKYKVLATPESVNTPVGIASWLIGNYKKNTQILIIEMGEHYRGDIKYLCGMTPPDFAIVTGINEAHLERLKTLENASATIFEIVENSKSDALVLLNADDNMARENYKRYIALRNVNFYSAKDDELSSLKVNSKKFDTTKLAWNFTLEKVGDVGVPVLGEYIISNAMAASLVALSLGMSENEIRKGLLQIKPVEHRLQPIKGENEVLVIDDSYNGNPEGVLEAINTISRFEGRRKIYITPGIVESSPKNKEIHTKIGKDLAEVADKVILIKNSATPFIADGLEEKGFKKEDIIWFNTAEEAHKSLGDILQPKDVILFQNDWGDQYL